MTARATLRGLKRQARPSFPSSALGAPTERRAAGRRLRAQAAADRNTVKRRWRAIETKPDPIPERTLP